MDKKLTINQVQDIIKISYPTALALAKTHGEMLEDGKWYVASSIIRAMIQDELNTATEKLARYNNVAG